MSTLFSSLCALLIFAGVARAEEQSLDLQVDVLTGTKDPGVARRELLDVAAKKGIEEFLKSEFGDEVFNKQRSLIESRIVKDFSKYVPSSRHVEIKELPEGFKSTVMVKLNRRDLMKRASEIGLRRPSEMEPIVLPVWTWIDEVKGVQHSWWQPMTSTENLWWQSVALNWETSAAGAFEKQGVQFLRPQQLKFVTAVPESARKMNLGKEDIDTMAKHWRAPMALDGAVRVSAVAGKTDVYRIDLNWTVRFLRNGREVGEIVRSFETDPGSFDIVVDRKLKEIKDTIVQEIAEQVGETRQRGTLQAETVEFEINGDLSPAQKELLRAHLAAKYRGIKGVRERILAGKKTTFEVDLVQPLPDAAKELVDITLPNMNVRLDSQESAKLVFKATVRKEMTP